MSTHIIERARSGPAGRFRARFGTATRHGPGFAWLRRLLAAYLHWRRLRRDERFLLGQPDHILKDMGIARADIEGAIRGTFHRDH